jgi:hypothetical protein
MYTVKWSLLLEQYSCLTPQTALNLVAILFAVCPTLAAGAAIAFSA